MAVGRNQLIAIGAVVAVGVGILIGVLVAGGEDGGGEGEDIQLVSASEPGADPFTPPAAPETAPPATVAPPQGPFGGTGDDTLCDREALVAFLIDPANAAQARAWAGVLGIDVGTIPSYVRDLIPTTTTSDIRITNHTFEGGRAVAFQAVLQTGTAVLVDTYGKPVARCRCGNPLLPPREVGKPVYVGTRWPGFDPDTIIVIKVSVTQIFPPGGTGTVPSTAPPTSTTTRPSGGDADQAIAFLRAAIDQCAASVGVTPEDVAALQYSATPTGTPDMFSVVIDDPVSGEFGTWVVNAETGDITAGDQIAAEVGSACPELA